MYISFLPELPFEVSNSKHIDCVQLWWNEINSLVLEDNYLFYYEIDIIVLMNKTSEGSYSKFPIRVTLHLRYVFK